LPGMRGVTIQWRAAPASGKADALCGSVECHLPTLLSSSKAREERPNDRHGFMALIDSLALVANKNPTVMPCVNSSFELTGNRWNRPDGFRLPVKACRLLSTAKVPCW